MLLQRKWAAIGALVVVVLLATSSGLFLMWFTTSLRWADFVVDDRDGLLLRNATVQTDDSPPEADVAKPFRDLPPLTAILPSLLASPMPTPLPSSPTASVKVHPVGDDDVVDDEPIAEAEEAPVLVLEDIPMFTPILRGRGP